MEFMFVCELHTLMDNLIKRLSLFVKMTSKTKISRERYKQLNIDVMTHKPQEHWQSTHVKIWALYITVLTIMTKQQQQKFK